MHLNLQAVQILAARGNNLRAATTAQVRAVALSLDAWLELVLGKDTPRTERRAWRIMLLDELFGDAGCATPRYGAPITSAKDLSFSEAWAVLDWAAQEGAYGDLCVWFDEKGETNENNM